MLLSFGKFLGLIIYYVVPIRKKHALQSVQSAFPEKSDAEVHAIVKGVYQNITRILVTHCFLPKMTPADVLANIDYVGEDILKAALAKERGVIVVSGHLGDWESMGVGLAAAGYPISLVVAPIRNPHMNKMITRYRSKMGVRLISKKGMAIRHISQDLREKRCVGMLIDQDAGRSGIFVEFFGRPASTPKGPAQYAMKRKVPIIAIFSFPQDDGRLKIVFEEVNTDFSDDDFIQQVTQDITARLEHHIRNSPEHWFGWLHRRFKSKPPSSN